MSLSYSHSGWVALCAQVVAVALCCSASADSSPAAAVSICNRYTDAARKAVCHSTFTKLASQPGGVSVVQGGAASAHMEQVLKRNRGPQAPSSKGKAETKYAYDDHPPETDWKDDQQDDRPYDEKRGGDGYPAPGDDDGAPGYPPPSPPAVVQPLFSTPATYLSIFLDTDNSTINATGSLTSADFKEAGDVYLKSGLQRF